ncbi:MAG: hypothetical protein Q8O88_05940 [bacterium]|nr:hypothetical protein [bacterium]
MLESVFQKYNHQKRKRTGDMTTPTPTEIEQKIENSPFPPDEIFRVARLYLGKAAQSDPAKLNVRKLLGDSKFYDGVCNHLQRETDRDIKLWEEKLIAEALRVLAESSQCRVELAVHSYGDYVQEKKRAIMLEQFNEFGVVSPCFIYDDLVLATSWRHLLINLSIGLRNIWLVVEESPDYKDVKVCLDNIQAYINASGLVMEKHHRVKDAGRHREAIDLRAQVREIIMTEAFADAQIYRDLLSGTKKCSDAARQDLSHEDRLELDQRNKGIK